MRHWCCALLGILSLTMAASGQNQGAEKSAPAPESRPRTQTESPVRKLREADNSRCLVCHISFDEEPLAVTHAKAGYGCVYCHGKSNAHTADENNVTAPEIMFAKAKINLFCLKCHAKAKLSDVHEPVLADKDPKHAYCTDCHGEHRVSHRSRNWDKTTGKLLPNKPDTPKK